MSKKQKTLFQQYLETNNKEDESDEMSDEVRLSYTLKFYGQNLADFHEVESENGMKIFKGLSEDGACKVTEKGGIFCESTGFTGNPIDFLLSQENLTSYGALTRYFYTMIQTCDPSEIESHSVLDKEPLIKKINAFKEYGFLNNKLESFGLDIDNVKKHPFWFDGYQRFFYLYLNRLGYPICKHEWRFDGDSYDESIFGVPRLVEHPEAERIYFVENPMQLVSMSELVSDPVYVRPTNRTYLYHDFSKMIEGKQVICMKAKTPRNSDLKNLDLTFLESSDPHELLWIYDQGEPKESDLSEELLRNMLSNTMDTASASIDALLKEKDIS